MTIEKFFELSLYEKNSVYNNLNINFNEYEVARKMISNYRKKYKDTLEKYKNDPEYQTIEKIQSIQMEIKNNRLQKVDDDKTFDHTVDDFYAE
jgi:vacuolar-type H+-ATPase subunit E/Vma4